MLTQQVEQSNENALATQERVKRPYLRKVVDEKPELSEAEQLNKVRDLNTYFNDPQVDTLLLLAQNELSQTLIEFNNQLPAYQEWEREYLKMKKVNDDIQSRIDHLEATISQLGRYRARVSNKDEYRIRRATSHTQAKRKPNNQSVRTDWIGLASETLVKIDKFVTPSQLWEAVLENNPELKKQLGSDPVKLASTSWSQRQKWPQIAAAPFDETRRKDNNLVLHNNKIGITAWTDENHKPTGKYLAHFMQS